MIIDYQNQEQMKESQFRINKEAYLFCMDSVIPMKSVCSKP